ncbi:MAG: hydrogenase nickel incorporation protein HypB, partial [Okeania sp. SIO2D1]|nr:hydrogenase nickel incorporation protein HypB [Okeania sp. SIO2D1]
SKMMAECMETLEKQYECQQFELVLVESLSNFGCPQELELGEHAKVALLSVTEGEEQPLKYPALFEKADCLLLTKIDLAPYLDIDITRIAAYIRQINPNITILPVSAKTGIGLEDWFDWLETKMARATAIVSVWLAGMFSTSDLWLDFLAEELNLVGGFSDLLVSI